MSWVLRLPGFWGLWQRECIKAALHSRGAAITCMLAHHQKPLYGTSGEHIHSTVLCADQSNLSAPHPARATTLKVHTLWLRRPRPCSDPPNHGQLAKISRHLISDALQHSISLLQLPKIAPAAVLCVARQPLK